MADFHHTLLMGGFWRCFCHWLDAESMRRMRVSRVAKRARLVASILSTACFKRNRWGLAFTAGAEALYLIASFGTTEVVP
jgi:hypothetical protein